MSFSQTEHSLREYRAALVKWRVEIAAGRSYAKPEPGQYGLRSATDLFMAKRMEEQANAEPLSTLDAKAPYNPDVERRPLHVDEQILVECLRKVRMTPASWEKRFYAGYLAISKTITPKGLQHLGRLAHKYRRQWSHPDKARLLALAEKMAATVWDVRRDADAQKYQQAMAAAKEQ